MNQSVGSILKGFKLNAILTALIELVLGIFLMMNPAASQFALCTILGIGILIFGVFNIISYMHDHYGYADSAKLFIGIAASIVALIFLINPGFLYNFVSLILAVFIITCACSQIRRALTLRDFGSNRWWIVLLVGICFIVLGLIEALNGTVVMTFIGATLAIEGVSDLLTIFHISKAAKNVRDNVVIRY